MNKSPLLPGKRGRYLDILRRAEAESGYDKNDINDQRGGFCRLGRFCRAFQALEQRCPAYIELADWQQAVDDGRRFLATWGEQAEALGWTSAELFGLDTPPERRAAIYQRLARYDHAGLVWLLQGRPVVALTTETAAIKTASGGGHTYRKYNKPAFGPMDDSLDDFDGAAW